MKDDGRGWKVLKSLKQRRQWRQWEKKGRTGREWDSCRNESSPRRVLLYSRPPGKRALVTGQRKFTLCLAKRIRGIAIAKWTICHRFSTSSPDKERERDSGLLRHFALRTESRAIRPKFNLLFSFPGDGNGCKVVYRVFAWKCELHRHGSCTRNFSRCPETYFFSRQCTLFHLPHDWVSLCSGTFCAISTHWQLF